MPKGQGKGDHKGKQKGEGKGKGKAKPAFEFPDLREGLNGMKDSLEKLQAKTEEMVEANEAGNKRPRLEENTGKSRAMEPFGGAGR